MWLTLTDDDGVVIDSWYVPDEESDPKKVRAAIEGVIPVYLDRREYEKLIAE